MRIITLPLLLLLVVAAAMSVTSANVSDVESTEENTFRATTLDMSLRSTAFDPATALEAGDETKRDVFVQNVGELLFKYSQAYQYLSGDTALCDALELKVDYQYYNNSGVLQTINKYKGGLSSFTLNTSGSDADLNNPNSLGFWANPTFAENEQWFVYTVSLPSGADSDLQNLTCSYNLVARAWQQDFAAYPQGFHDEEILGNTVASGEWFLSAPTNEGWNVPTDPPISPNHTPLNLSCGGTTNGGNPATPTISQNWSAVDHADVHYQREVTYPNGTTVSYFYEPTNNYTPFVSFDTVAGIEGLWRTRVRAFVDRNGSGANNVDEGVDLVSDWSNECDVTLDKTAPTTTATITNSPTKPVEERMVNGGFENGLTGWTPSGQVTVINGTDGAYAAPHGGTHMAKIGQDTNPGNPVSVNIISQPIPAGIRSVGFYYNFYTQDVQGYDEPGMMVYVNDKQVQQIWAGDVNSAESSDGSAHSTGWQRMNVYVGDVTDATLTIAFYSGNTGSDDPDFNSQSWLYVDDVTTLDMTVNANAQFDLATNDPQATIYYKLGTDGAAQAGNSFTLSAKPTGGQVTYWAVDQTGNKENDHTFYVDFDNQASNQITDLSVNNEGGGEYTLRFLAPSDDLQPQVSEYDIRYSTSPITVATDWSSLLVPTRQVSDGLPGTIRAPRPAGEQETIVLTGLAANQEYYFALKSADSAHNWSDMSNVVHISPSVVVLNEILYNPTGDPDDGTKPNGEWVELFNNSDSDVDANGWYVKTVADQTLTITTSNSDNNLDLEDAGETVVPAHGRLTVYVNGTAMFNNGGDTLTLYQVDHSVVDAHSYIGGKTEGATEARNPDGLGNWVDPVATPGTPNVLTVDELLPQVKLWQQDMNHVKFGLFDAQMYEQAVYVIKYNHLTDDGTLIPDGLEGNLKIQSQSRAGVKNIYLGTCSDGGQVCVPHKGIKELTLEVTLTKADGTVKILNYDLPGAWKE